MYFVLLILCMYYCQLYVVWLWTLPLSLPLLSSPYVHFPSFSTSPSSSKPLEPDEQGPCLQNLEYFVWQHVSFRAFWVKIVKMEWFNFRSFVSRNWFHSTKPIRWQVVVVITNSQIQDHQCAEWRSNCLPTPWSSDRVRGFVPVKKFDISKVSFTLRGVGCILEMQL